MAAEQEPRQKLLIAGAGLRAILEDRYDLVEVETGTQAVAALQRDREPVSLVLLEAALPELDGFAVLACKNECPWLTDVPAVLLFSDPSQADLDRAVALGAADCFTYPLHPALTRRRVENLLTLAVGNRPQEETPEAILPQSLLEEGSCRLTARQARILTRSLENVFDIVRLVDPGSSCEFFVDPTGDLVRQGTACFCVWDRGGSCDNCVSARCITTRSRLDKFEFVGEEIYHVVAQYVEVDDRPYSLEMVLKIADGALLSATGQERLANIIAAHNKKLYNDPVSGVYNRRYYEEQLDSHQRVQALAVIDVDDFKAINDTYGHQTGDKALGQIAGAVRSCLRKSDCVVRYGGDEFVVMIPEITREVFFAKLEQIQQAVAQVTLAEHPALRFSVSIGGAYGEGEIPALLHQADQEMYRRKRARKSPRTIE